MAVKSLGVCEREGVPVLAVQPVSNLRLYLSASASMPTSGRGHLLSQTIEVEDESFPCPRSLSLRGAEAICQRVFSHVLYQPLTGGSVNMVLSRRNSPRPSTVLFLIERGGRAASTRLSHRLGNAARTCDVVAWL